MIYVTNDKKISKDAVLWGLDSQQSKQWYVLTVLQMVTVPISTFNADKQWNMIPLK